MVQPVNRIPFNSVPNSWAMDPEIGPFIRDLLTLIDQTRERTGGDTDEVSNIEVSIVAQDGGNRSMTRRYNDDIERLDSHVTTAKRLKDFTPAIEHLQSQISGIKKAKDYSTDIQSLNDLVWDLKRKNRTLEGVIRELQDSISALKSTSLIRSLEQRIDELETRIDTGV
jgi:uncharacterized coiled-coil DUF342 family protein